MGPTLVEANMQIARGHLGIGGVGETVSGIPGKKLLVLQGEDFELPNGRPMFQMKKYS